MICFIRKVKKSLPVDRDILSTGLPLMIMIVLCVPRGFFI